MSFSDFAYGKGSILHAISDQQYLIIGVTNLMTGILILGLLYREKKGIARIGWESVAIIVVYLLAYVFLIV